MAEPIHRLGRIVDKEWIRVGWAGMPTLRHHLIAFTPLAILVAPAMVAERWSYEAGAAILFIGILAYCEMIIWIHVRRLAGLGPFSSRRSDRVIKRHRRRRARLAAAKDGD